MNSPISPFATITPALTTMPSHISSLFPELLECIFVLCVHSNLTSPLVLGRVCKLWRDVVQQAGRLWTRINFGVPGQVPYFLARSHGCDLHVVLYPTGGHLIHNEQRRVWQTLSKERVTTLALNVFFLDDFSCGKASGAAFERLSKLVLTSGNDQPYDRWSFKLHQLEIWQDLQKLEVLVLHNFNISAANVLKTIHQLGLLKFVCITTHGNSAQPISDRFVSEDADAVTVPDVSLPNLRCFKAGPVSQKALTLYMEKLKLPPSSILYIDVYRGEKIDIPSSLLQFSHLALENDKMFLDTRDYARSVQTHRTIIQAYSYMWTAHSSLSFDCSYIKELEVESLRDICVAQVWLMLEAASFPNVTTLIMDSTSPRWESPFIGFPKLEQLHFRRCDLQSWDSAEQRLLRPSQPEADDAADPLPSPTEPDSALKCFLQKRNTYCCENGFKEISHVAFHGCSFQPGAPEVDAITRAGFRVLKKDYSPNSLKILWTYFYDARYDWDHVEKLWFWVQYALSLNEGVDGEIDGP